MTLTTFLATFDRLKPAGVNRWIARCPVPTHDDRTPSLSIALGAEGRRLLHCFGNCTLDQILAAAGLEVADLFPSPRGSAQEARGRASYREMVFRHVEALERLAARRWDPLRASIEEGELIRLERQIADRCRRLANTVGADTDLAWDLREMAALLDATADESEARIEDDLRARRRPRVEDAP